MNLSPERRLFLRALPLTRTQPLDPAIKESVIQMYQAVLAVEPEHLATLMAHFQHVLMPEALDLLVDHLIIVLRHKDGAEPERAALALGLLGPEALFPLGYQLARTQSSTVGVRLMEALGVMLRLGPAPLSLVLRTLHTSKLPQVREAARRVLAGIGLQVPGENSAEGDPGPMPTDALARTLEAWRRGPFAVNGDGAMGGPEALLGHADVLDSDPTEQSLV